MNTDAEGRLVLADGIVRSGEDNPVLIVDVATLTGAATVALGGRTTGVMGSSDEVAAGAARSCGTRASPPGPCRSPRSCARASTPPSPT